MTTRATASPLRALPVLVAFLFNLVVPIVPLAVAPTLALAGTSFNAADGNLTDDGAETDWCTPVPNLANWPDSASGSGDTSFTTGNNKEDSNVPSLGNGTIPNNKDDLLRQYVASETVAGALFVYLAWVRADPTGTSTIDFEFNQSDQISSNGVTHVRTDGDLLVSFDFKANPGSGGGYTVDLVLRTWDNDVADIPDPTSSPANTGAWVNPVDLDASGLAEGSVNGADVSDCVAGGTVATGTFGEAALNLTAILGGECKSFGSLFTKSRSSGSSFSSDLKDRIDPVPVSFSTCGQITILKQDEDGNALGGATFSVTPDPFDGVGSLSVTDNVAPDDNPAAGTIHLSEVEPGDYTVCETAAPAGYILDPNCQALTVADNGSATFGPFVNGLGDISWTKLDGQSDLPLCCATFTLEGIAGAALGFSLSVTDNGSGDEDPDAGELLVTDLLLGTYRITETVPPTGYDLPSPAYQDVVLSGQTASAAFAFEDAPQADASIDKEAVVDPIVAGEPASFTITVIAGGTGDSEDVVLTDLNDTGHDWTVSGADAGACTDTTVADGETLTCDFGTVPNGETRSVTITMASDPDDCELGIANTASVSSSNDHDSSNNQDSDSIVVLCPNPGVVKEAVADPIVFGEDAVFTITVTAGGTGPAENVVLSDLNDTGHNWTVSGTDAGACADTTVADGETLVCTWASIPAGESRTITITMTSGAGDCELGIENTASITADADVDESNNSDSDSISVLCPNPGVTKDAEVDPITSGDQASFEVTVTASGTGDSENVVLTDLNDTGHDWTVSGADAGACADTTVAHGETLTCDFGTVPNGESRTVTITMTSNADDCALGIENTAVITADADVDESDNSDSASIEVLCPDLEIDKSTSTPVVSAGDVVHYTVTVSNADGDGEARDVVISDDLPAGLTWTEDSESCSILDGTLSCGPLDIPAGDDFSVTLTGTTDADDCPSIENTASFDSSNGGSGSSDSDERGPTVITVNCPDLTVDKEPVETPISAGEEGQFTIVVTNNGPGTAYDVVLTDTAPPGTVWTVVDDGGMTCDDAVVDGQQSITCQLDELATEGSVELLISYTTTREDCGTLDNAVAVAASNEPQANTEDNFDQASIVVECPGLNIVKSADADPIDAGETASFTITVWNAGPGSAFDVVVTDDLPDGVDWAIDLQDPDADDSCASSVVDGHQSFSCEFGTLPVTDMAGGKVIIVSGETDRDDCGLLDNTAFADASNSGDPISSRDTITVRCPEVAIEKVNDQSAPVLPGTNVRFTLTVTVSDGPANDVVVVDTLPTGYDAPTSISDGGTYDAGSRQITWELGDLADGSYDLSYQAKVGAGVANGTQLVNVAAVTSPNSQCPDLETLEPECDDDSTVTVRVPTLVIDKAANAEVITISGPAGAQTASPSVVTWTLTYTLTNGPVTNAVITDPVPAGLVYVSGSASNGGVYDAATRTLTWSFATLTTSGSVTFQTTVDVATISRTAPTVNVAVIRSDQTPPDEGSDSVSVVVEPPPLGGTPTPAPSVPNTALGVGPAGQPVTVPLELMAALFLGSLGALAFANVRAARRGRR
ncbi:MAG: SpaA isopeptide-forming pilin-related protein [Candidatus Limnocylindria bacterium]